MVRLISEVRSVRTEMNVPPGTLTPILLRDAAPETLARGQRWMEAIRPPGARIGTEAAGRRHADRARRRRCWTRRRWCCRWPRLIDLGAERARLTRERDKAAGEARKIGQKLDNADFVRRAPEEVVEENRERLAVTRRRDGSSRPYLGILGRWGSEFLTGRPQTRPEMNIAQFVAQLPSVFPLARE